MKMTKSKMKRTISDFLVTKEYHKFEEFCNSCFREKYIGLCHGVPGVGKTLSAKYYAQLDTLEQFNLVTKKAAKKSLASKVLTNQTIFYTANILNTPKRINMAIKNERFQLFRTRLEAFKLLKPKSNYEEDFRTLIIIDEADRLTMRSIEQVRDIYDRLENVGIVLIGMPGIEKRLSRYAQLYSRVGFLHEFRPIKNKEINFILQQYWSKLGLKLKKDIFSDPEVTATIARITKGNFRLIQRLFSQIKRIVTINKLSVVNKEVIEAARKCMVIGQS